jgi:glycosyltransferase involved in cell wall biosynthesis
MRVLILGSLAESLLNFRGALIQEIVQKDHDVIACAPNASSEVRNKLNAKGVRYQNIFIERTGINPIKDIHTIMNLRAVFRRIKPAIILSYTIKPVIYGSIAGKMVGVPGIYSMITGVGYAFSNKDIKSRCVNKIVGWLYRRSLKHNHKIFFQNPDDLLLFKKLEFITEQQAVLINGSGVDVDYFKPAAFSDDISFLMIARLIREKGIAEYVGAAYVLKKKYPHVTFSLIGLADKGNPASVSEQNLHMWVEQGIVEHIGALADVRPAIAASSIYVLPSYREGTPRTVLEAMAMGRPIITTEAPGCRETVQHGENGFLVPVKDVPALTNAMERFIRHPELIRPMGQRSRQIAVEKYDVHKVNAAILKMIGIE